jgi:hypothetical protein
MGYLPDEYLLHSKSKKPINNEKFLALLPAGLAGLHRIGAANFPCEWIA